MKTSAIRYRQSLRVITHRKIILKTLNARMISSRCSPYACSYRRCLQDAFSMLSWWKDHWDCIGNTSLMSVGLRPKFRKFWICERALRKLVLRIVSFLNSEPSNCTPHKVHVYCYWILFVFFYRYSSLCKWGKARRTAIPIPISAPIRRCAAKPAAISSWTSHSNRVQNGVCNDPVFLSRFFYLYMFILLLAIRSACHS